MFGCLHLADATPQVDTLLHDFAESLSPIIEHSGPGRFVVDLSNCPPPASWAPPLPHLRFTLATTPDLAYLAALADLPQAPAVHVPPDFDPLPLSILGASRQPAWQSCLPLLHLWGLHTCGEFKQLPRRDLADHANPGLAQLHAILHGATCRPLRLIRPIESFVCRICLDQPLASLDGLMFQANTLLQDLCTRLQARHLGATALHLEVLLESGDPLGRTIRLAEPSHHLATLQRILHGAMESWKAPAPVVELAIRADPGRLVTSQREWLGRQLSHPQRWPETLTALEALLGPDRIGIPLPLPDHRPDTVRLHPASTPGRPDLPADPQSVPTCALPLRRFRPPVPVAVAGEGHGLRFRPLALLGGPHPGPIRRCLGPFPLSGHWWDDSASWRRIEWDIELESRHLLRLALLPPRHWQLEGCY